MLNKDARAVLLKGGHLAGDVVSDLLLTQNAKPHWMRATRIHTANTHGTGCTLSSAIAALWRWSLRCLMRLRPHGSLNHGHAPLVMRLKPTEFC